MFFFFPARCHTFGELGVCQVGCVGEAGGGGTSRGQRATSRGVPPGQVRGWFLFLLLFLERASGTICSTIGCNFTAGCTFPLKLHFFFPLPHPIRPPPPSPASTPSSALSPSLLQLFLSCSPLQKLSSVWLGRRGRLEIVVFFILLNTYPNECTVFTLFEQHVLCVVTLGLKTPLTRSLYRGGEGGALFSCYNMGSDSSLKAIQDKSNDGMDEWNMTFDNN